MDRLSQADYIDGKLVVVGDETRLKDGDSIYSCTAGPEIVEELRAYLDGSTIRAFGTADWLRHADGRWELQAFSIDNFIPLDDKPLDQVLK
jgi:hypothetical protein